MSVIATHVRNITKTTTETQISNHKFTSEKDAITRAIKSTIILDKYVILKYVRERLQTRYSFISNPSQWI